jgi:hypothetical protein
MAWQLIYTSAPRLLEAGRTGFGTVARHRAVSGLLASTIERFSQFARLQGHDSKRVIYTHRILTVGSSKFHVLSYLRDAGSDYTGRTNHIAHHIIAEPRETRALAAIGITPADVLLATPWRTSWSDSPRYLDSAEEIDLVSTPPSESHAWEQLTGSEDFSRLPMAPEAKRGCYFIIPPSVDARLLFRESLAEVGGEAWQTTFTSCFEPNDDSSDFRWIGLSPSSPLRVNVENSSRVVFDLEKPQTLPTPPAPPRPITLQDEQTIQPELVEGPSAISVAPTASSAEPETIGAPTMGSFDDWSPRKTRGRKRAKSWRPMVIGAVAILALAGGALTVNHLHKKRLREQAILALQSRIANMWNRYQLKLDDSKAWLEGKTKLLTESEMDPLLGEYEECLKQIGDSLASGQILLEPQMPSQSADDFADFIGAYQGWMTAKHAAEESSTVEPPTPATIQPQLTRLEKERKAWETLSSHYRKPPQVAFGPREHLAKTVKETLVRGKKPEGKPGQWMDILNQLQQPLPSWLNDWERLESGRPDLSVEEAAKIGIRLRTNSQQTPPAWLLNLATATEQGLRRAPVKPMITPPAPIKEKTIAKPAPENPDSPTSKHPIYIYQGPRDTILAKEGELNVFKSDVLEVFQELEALDEMQIAMGAPNANGKDLPVWGSWTENRLKKYRPQRMSLEEAVFSKGTLSTLKTKTEGCRLIARTGDGVKVLFEVLILPSNIEPILVFSPSFKIQATSTQAGTTLRGLGDFIRRLRFPGSSLQGTFQLCRDSPATEDQMLFHLEITGRDCTIKTRPAAPATAFRRQDIERQIDEKQKSINSDDQAIARIPPKQADGAKKKQRIESDKAKKVAELEQLKQMLASLEKPRETKPPDLTGKWLLQVSARPSASERYSTLCRLEVGSSDAQSPQ